MVNHTAVAAELSGEDGHTGGHGGHGGHGEPAASAVSFISVVWVWGYMGNGGGVDWVYTYRDCTVRGQSNVWRFPKY